MNLIIKTNRKTGKKYIPCYDLHGYSIKEAYMEVKYVILKCFKMKINSINFVTGRGNHPNVNGKRGILFQTFKEWLEDDEIINLIRYHTVGDGSHKVYLNKNRKEKKKNNKKMTKTDVKNESVKSNKILVLKHSEKHDSLIKNEETNPPSLIRKEFQKELNIEKIPSNNDYLKTIFNLGILLKKNNENIGIEFIQEAAENGYGEAQHYLGKAYIEGCVPKRDYEKSILNVYNYTEAGLYIAHLHRSLYWFNRSVKHNHPEAQFFLGNLCINVDRKGALKWYTVSAENGQANAQYILGQCYELGLLGLEKNKSKSLKWYIKSAEQGHSLARIKTIKLS